MDNERAVVYSVQKSAAGDTLEVKQVWPGGENAEGLPAGYTTISPLVLGKKTYLLAQNPKDRVIDIYQAGDKGKGFTLAGSGKIGSARDIIKTFFLGGDPYLLAYEAKKGVFEFFKVEKDLVLTPVYKNSKTYGEDLTTDYTVVAPFIYRDGIYYLCYNIDSGKVTIYQVSVPPERPLQTSLIYLHTWAQGWTRFAFFTLGGENFFLKSNPKYNNVNIDHIVDDPSQGGHPVGRHLVLPFDLDNIASFYMNGGDPYFVTYKKNGETVYNRIHGDCLGWTEQAEIGSPEQCDILCPFMVGTDQFILFYASKA